MERIKFKSPSLAVVAVLVGLVMLIFGCGGGGGDGSTTSSQANGSTNSGAVAVQLYAVYNGTESPASITPTSTFAAPVYNLAVGDKIHFEYIGVSPTSNSVHITVQGSAVTTNAPASIGTITSNVFTVGAASGATAYTFNGAYQGKAYSLKFVTVATQAKAVGTVRDPTLAPVLNVPLTFVNAAGGVVGQTVTGLDGSFVASLPTTAVAFYANFAGFGNYYNEYSYGSANYAITVSGCNTLLPKLTSGQNTALPDQVVPYLFDQNNPPPVPDGCG